MTFTKLFSSLTDSSIWCQDDHTRLVWITMLAMADKHGRVWAAVPGLAARARVPIEAAERALATFLAPDSHSRTKDFEGRRIEAIDGGWRLLNYQKYRDIRDDEDRRTKDAERQRKRRAGLNGKNVTECHTQSRDVAQSHDNAEADAEAENDKTKTFEKPTIEEVRHQCTVVGLPETEAEKFWDYNEDRGWKIDGRPMKSWVLTLSTWKRNWNERNGRKPQAKPKADPLWAREGRLKAELKELEDRLPQYFDRDADPVGAARMETIKAELKAIAEERKTQSSHD